MPTRVAPEKQVPPPVVGMVYGVHRRETAKGYMQMNEKPLSHEEFQARIQAMKERLDEADRRSDRVMKIYATFWIVMIVLLGVALVIISTGGAS